MIVHNFLNNINKLKIYWQSAIYRLVFFIFDFSPKVPFICAGENYPGPFKITTEWSAYICKDNPAFFAQNGQIFSVRMEGILVLTTLGQKENTHEEERSNRRKNGAGDPASKERHEQSEDCGIHWSFLREGSVSDEEA